jgi:DNA helicase-2/ATP-dependent DNA helicase PcrA
MDELDSMGGKSIEKVIEFAEQRKIRIKDDALSEFLVTKRYLYDRVKKVSFEEVEHLFNYTEDFTPYSTQAGIKGAEFENVFVSLDNGGWSSYSFEGLFNGKESKQSVIDRTRMMFYVSCTRAMERLVVYFVDPNDAVLERASSWFGSDSVLDVST